jgi:hypothetical protein
MERFCQPVIAHDKVRFVGEPLAVVLADTPAKAEDALGLIDVDIEPLAPTAPLFEQHGSNDAFEYRASRGDVEAAFRRADYTRRERLYVHRHTGIKGRQSSAPLRQPAAHCSSKRLEATHDAVITVQPALMKFYDGLSDEQKARFNSLRSAPVGSSPAVAKREHQSAASELGKATDYHVVVAPPQRLDEE